MLQIQLSITNYGGVELPHHTCDEQARATQTHPLPQTPTESLAADVIVLFCFLIPKFECFKGSVSAGRQLPVCRLTQTSLEES